MSVLNKPYEISIWGDTWDSTQNKFIEEKLLIIGSNIMTSQSRVLLPKLVENVNGTHTLTFTIYYRYKDNITGQTVDNPYVPYLTNERKLKLRYDDVNNADYEWYDFVIKNIKVDTAKHAYEIIATDQYVNELSKNGFNFTFDPEITNPSNVGTIQELASRALEDTDWNVIDRSTSAPIVSEFIPDLAKETLVKLSTNNSLTAIKINDSTEGLAPTFIQNQSIPSDSIIYAFYSCLADQAQRFQFIYKAPAEGATEPVFEKDSERVITEKSCQYYIDDLGYGSLNTAYGIYTPNSCSIEGISTDYRGARYVFSPDTRYNSVIDRYVTIYNKNNEQYYGYTKSETIVPNIIQNWVTNPNTFKSTNGWHVGTTNSSSIPVGTLQNEAINSTGHTLLEDLRTNSLTNTYHAILSYTPVTPATAASNHIIVNTGFYDNRYSINNLKNGQKFVCRIKATGTISNTVAIKLGTVDQKYYNFSTTLAVGNFEDLDDGYKTAILTIENSTFTPKNYKKQNVNRVYIVLSGTNPVQIEDFQIFEYVPKGNTFLKPEDQLVNAVTTTTYILYSKSQIDDLGIGQTLDDINPIYEGTVSPTELNPAYTIELKCEKRRAITAKESNYFNIIQTLCETFECWAKFNITHNINGQITGKSIEFHNYVGQINYAGFRYGVNLKSITRTDDSKSIVTKLIVKQNSNEFGQNGFCTIARAPSNETGEINIYNLDHYINQGLLSASDWNNAIYNLDNSIGCDITANWSPFSTYLQYSIVKYDNKLYQKITSATTSNYPPNDPDNWQEVTDTATNSNGYYYRLRQLNNQINSKNDILLQKARSFAQAQADVQLYEAGLAAALDAFQDATDNFQKLTGYDYNDAGADAYSTSLTYNIGDRAVYNNQIYQCTANGTTGSWDASKWIVDIVETKIDYLVKCAEAYQAKEDYTTKVNSAKTYYENLETEYNSLNNDINILISQKKLLNKAFYEKFYRFIQEGTWISEEYYDDEKYYLDALSTLYNSSVPKVSYNIAVLELSQLTGYEYFKFNIGDRTYIEDTEFFGYDNNGNPIREEVILSEITYNLDEPDKNTIKIQNFKTQFQDLFKRITATVQQVQFSTGAYDQAAELARASDQDKSKYLQGALNDASTILQNLAEQTVKQDSTGLTITDKLEPNNILRAVSGGILLTKDGGNTWTLGITANGINASVITSGILNTGEINIMNGNEATFRWDAFGLTAYNFKANGQIISNISQSGGVRFDRLGIYGFANTTSDWHPTDVVDWEVTNNNSTYQIKADTSSNIYVRNHSLFELTKEGLYLNLGNMVQKHYCYYNNNDLKYDTFSSPIAHSSVASIGRINDLIYNYWDAEDRPVYLNRLYNYDTVYAKGDIVKNLSNVYYRSLVDNNEEHLLSETSYWAVLDPQPVEFVQIFKAGINGNNTLAMYDDGTLIGTQVKLTGSINATSGSIGGWNIDNGVLSSTLIESNISYTLNLAPVTSTNRFCLEFKQSGNGTTTRPFFIRGDGFLYASNANISGEITATSGKIGGWDINEYSISKYNTASIIYGLSLNAPMALTTGTSAITVWNNGQEKFKLTYGGDLTATSADIQGKITATSGIIKGSCQIGAWNIESDKDLVGDDTIYLIPDGDGLSGIGGALYSICEVSPTNLSFRIGSNTAANFGIGADGTLYAPKAKIGKWLIDGSNDYKGSLYTEYILSTWTYKIYLSPTGIYVKEYVTGSTTANRSKFKYWHELWPWN